ncbi:MAG: OmpA family protein [Bacteroidales bacterium]|nr:OmpA family protein [Bacteroidales bacterium]
MKRTLLLVALACAGLSSCVTMSKYETLQAQHNMLKKEHNVTRQELQDMKDEYASLQRQFQSQSAEITDLNMLRLEQEGTIKDLHTEMENLRLGYDTIIENYMQQISGKNKSLDKANNLLAIRTKELQDRENAFAVKEQALLDKQAELERGQAAAKKELETLRNSVTNALVGFKDKGLNVEVKDSKVYVSMESKLMFSSGSWTVSKEGQEAIQNLAKVLEDNPDLNIMVEGHTDNDAFKGATAVKDNWDLSVMRATAIVKLLLQYGKNIDPIRIEASGHSEYAPKVPNNSAANKAQNRRTEIILTPNLDALMKVVK